MSGMSNVETIIIHNDVFFPKNSNAMDYLIFIKAIVAFNNFLKHIKLIKNLILKSYLSFETNIFAKYFNAIDSL